MVTLLKLWCDNCQSYQWHILTPHNLFRCLGCIERGDDKHLCVATSRRIIAVS